MANELDVQAKGIFILAQVNDDAGDKPYEIVDSSQENVDITAVSVGDEVKNCVVGDKILPFGNQFVALNRNGKKYLILTDEQVFGVVNAE